MSANEFPGGSIGMLRTIVSKMAHSPIRHYVTPGLTSELIGGERHGKLRMFSCDRDTRDWVTPHSHRFDFTCLVLMGTVTNILYRSGGGNAFAVGTLAQRNGGMGGYAFARGDKPAYYYETSTDYGAGETYSMTHREIHSIRFSRNCEVLFFEGPEVSDTSLVLEPWSNGAVVPTFETAPWMFQKEPA